MCCQTRNGRTDHLEEQTVRDRLAAVAATSNQSRANGTGRGRGELAGDVFIPGGLYMLGGVPSQPWVFDAERFAHPVTVAPFEISKAPVTNAE
jgi:iron(II)-dependent oxidoreductase